MRIIRNLSYWPQAAQGSIMALGNFDGVHLGHQAVIGRAREIARNQNRPLAIMTFEPHPRRFFQPELPILRIVPFSEKARLLRDAGVDYLFVARFNAAFSMLSAEEFVQHVLLKGLHVAHVVTGHNFAFGYRRGGNVEYLNACAKEKGFVYTRVDAAVMEGGEVYSSTAIRTALSEGQMEEVATLLGRNYVMRGPVIHGDRRGHSIGFPTANIRPVPLYSPRLGVYAVRLHVQGQVYPAVANLGMRPTVDGAQKLLEVHAFDASLECYGVRANVEFLSFIRPERKFSGLDALKAQINDDVRTAKAIHNIKENRLQA